MSWRDRALGTLLAVFVVALVPPSTLASPVSTDMRELTLLVGAGQDTMSAEGFFPETVRVRAGDRVTWKINSDAEHTVSFLGGATPTVLAGAAAQSSQGTGIVTSGPLTRDPRDPGAGPTDSFSVRFDAPGTYMYVCLLHGSMQGQVDVVAAAATDVPDQVAIDAEARAEMDVVLALAEEARVLGSAPRRAVGPNDTTRWYIRAGNPQAADPRVHLAEFLPRDLAISAGDTVVWEANDLHTVTFVPVAPPPPWLTSDVRPDGSVALAPNPQLTTPAKPAAVYDPRQYFNSGSLGATHSEDSWELTFTQPGTFTYFCGVHRELGMTGTITVLSR